ncbi:MAG: class I SAM-dependent methyltransferase [Actinomycetota bacterium]|nr:class I SAM-dependent methyltransferase [Actinomycetota bacterium]
MNEIKNISLGQPIEYGFLGIKRRAELIKRHVNLNAKYILDIGCGNGAQSFAFLEDVRKCVAIDVEEERLQTFRDNLERRNIRNCDIMTMDATSLDFPDNKFDACLCIETLEHIQQQEKALNEMHRVLKESGNLVLSVPNRWWIFETHGASLPFLPWNRIPFFSWLPKKTHDRYARARIYTKREIIELVKNAGFRVLAIEYFMPPLDKLKRRSLQKFLRKILFSLEKTRLGLFGVSIFVFAKK